MGILWDRPWWSRHARAVRRRAQPRWTTSRLGPPSDRQLLTDASNDSTVHGGLSVSPAWLCSDSFSFLISRSHWFSRRPRWLSGHRYSSTNQERQTDCCTEPGIVMAMYLKAVNSCGVRHSRLRRAGVPDQYLYCSSEDFFKEASLSNDVSSNCTRGDARLVLLHTVCERSRLCRGSLGHT